MQVLRLKKYDEFFIDCNKKLNTNDQILKAIEKKLKDEIATINGQKNMLKEKLGQMEAEVNTFVSIHPFITHLIFKIENITIILEKLSDREKHRD